MSTRYLGDFTPGKTVRGRFNSVNPASGAPVTLAGSPALAIYKDGGASESTAGVTLTVDFDSRTGLHFYAVDTSADGSFYSAGSDFAVVLTSGTAGGTSVAGIAVGAFSLANRSALRPTVADRTVQVDASGQIVVGVIANDAITAAAIAATAITEIQAGLSTLDAAGIRAAVGLASANLDTQLSAIDTAVDSILDDTGTSGVVIATATQAAIADKTLGRNVSGGSDGGRTVSEALYAIRNRVDFPVATGGTMTVYATDDTTPSWTATVTLASRDPATSINPA